MSERAADGNVLRAEPVEEELFETLAASDAVLVERIVSAGQATPGGQWLVQDRDEWVVLLDGEAELSFADGSRLRLRPGDHALIRAGERHRVEWTRVAPPCVWVAVHASGLRASGDVESDAAVTDAAT